LGPGGFQLLGQTSLLKPGECSRDHLQAREPSGRERDAVEGILSLGFCSWFAPSLLRVGAGRQYFIGSRPTVTLITLDDFAVCAREDKKEKAARVSGLGDYLCKGYPDNGHPTVIVCSSVARVNSVRLAAKGSAESA
jgi:hypothetical protein